MTCSLGNPRLQFFAYINREERRFWQERRRERLEEEVVIDQTKTKIQTEKEKDQEDQENLGPEVEMRQIPERTLRQLAKLDMI